MWGLHWNYFSAQTFCNGLPQVIWMTQAGWGLLVCSPSHREHLLPCLSRPTRQGEAVIRRPHLHPVVVHKHLGTAVRNYIPPICEGECPYSRKLHKPNFESWLSCVTWGSKSSSVKSWTCYIIKHLPEHPSNRHNTYVPISHWLAKALPLNIINQ